MWRDERNACMLHTRVYIRTSEPRARPRMCAPRTAFRRFQRRHGLAATSQHVHRRTWARAYVYIHAYAVCRDSAAPTARSHRLFEATAGARNERVCRNTLADRAAPITARAIYRRREIRAQGRAFSARARLRAKPRDREFRPVTQEFRSRLVRARAHVSIESQRDRRYRIWIVYSSEIVIHDTAIPLEAFLCQLWIGSDSLGRKSLSEEIMSIPRMLSLRVNRITSLTSKNLHFLRLARCLW